MIIYPVVDTRRHAEDDAPFIAKNARFHRDYIVAFGLAPMGIIAFELHLGSLEIIARVVFVVKRYGADIEHFDLVQYLAVILRGERKHLQHRWLGAIVTVFCTSLALCHPDSFMAIFAYVLDVFRHE